jgi:tRNA (guanine-N7-)-methyltransferase
MANPETLFIGIELARKYCAVAAAKAERAGLSNAVLIAGDAVRFVALQVPDASVDAFHVYFPDPWWKKRHKKRRVVNEVLLTNIQRALKPGGELHFWTDVLDYFEASLALIAEVTTLVGPELVAESEAQHQMDYRTHFERRARLNGLPVYRSLFRKAAQ